MHLYNESYTRHIDYDIEEIRSLRQKNKEKKLTGDDLELQKKENDRKLRE